MLNIYIIEEMILRLIRITCYVKACNWLRGERRLFKEENEKKQINNNINSNSSSFRIDQTMDEYKQKMQEKFLQENKEQQQK